MNNKVLLGIVAFLVIVGGVILLSNQFNKKTTSNTPTINKIETQAQQQQPTQEPIARVTFTSSGFSPSTLKIKAGTRVIWINKSGSVASVNSDPHSTHRAYPSLNLGRFPSESSVELVFDKPETYKYHNHLNPDQTGTVVVE